MADRVMMKGNEAIAEGAIRAGCHYFFGYPITPQNEVPEYMAKRLPEIGGTFIQAESEVSAINMVYGAAGAGARAMTSSSSPGVSLKMEGISYIAGAELPCVIVNVSRGGPGLGGLAPSQSDYFQATKGGGHGDYRLIVLAPASVQEIIDLMYEGFVTADKYRNPVMILADGILGQMMEPVTLSEVKDLQIPPKPWATTGMINGKPQSIINSLGLAYEDLEKINIRLQKKYQEIAAHEIRFQEEETADAELIIVAYGTSARVAKTAMIKAKAQGKKVGLFRPISLWPFPSQRIQELAQAGKRFLVVEMSAGQMVEDVKLAVNGKTTVDFYGKLNGTIPSVIDVNNAIIKCFASQGVA
ncbi:MAG TPA: 3-methyl-2-oxobutanoate dehydrogenase subunit beta [Firmicutes bacterium]|jgi:2-oxoglutarate/2-oxoacid ferredoxin oxidoreductase subunit alpha|nr:3-methyl-2-oxobutanoate dehydrogenase subunit beta [Bacillota bacterium]